MKITCACKKEEWVVYQMTDSKGVVDCKECHTQVWFELNNITYLA